MQSNPGSRGLFRSWCNASLAAFLVVLLAIEQVPADMVSQGDPDPAMAEAVFTRYQQIEREHGATIEIDGIQFHYLEWNADQSIPLIWLHGKGSSAYEMVEVAPQLADMGVRVLALDQRGHAGTVYLQNDFSVFTMADDVAGLMDKLNLPCAIVGGLSFGGGVASAFYDQYPERVIALVLEDGGNTSYLEIFENIPESMTKNEVPPVLRMSFDSQQEAFLTLVPMFTSALRRPGPLPIDLLTSFYSWFIPDGEGKWRLHPHNSGFERDPELPYYSYKNPLPQRSRVFLQPEVIFRDLHVPTLIVDPIGDDDIPLWDRKALNQRLIALAPDQFIYSQWPDATHAQHVEQPQNLIRDMGTLLDVIQEQRTGHCLTSDGHQGNQSVHQGS